jgi:hypothetical protein
MPVNMDIEVPRNGSFARTSQLVDDQGEPIDLTSNEMAIDVRRLAGDGGAPVASFDVEVEPGTQGFFTESIVGTSLASVEGPFQTVRLAYDLRRVDGAGLPTVERRGSILLTPGVTYG